MADSPVALLTASDALTGTELFYADGFASLAAADVKVTANQIRTFASALSLPLAGGILIGALTVNLNATAAPTPAAGTVAQLVNADSTMTRMELDSFGAISAFTVRRANGTNASKTALASNDQIGAFNFHGYYVTGGPAYSGVQASLQGFATQAWTSTTLGTKIVLSTTPNGSTTLTTAATFGQDQSLAVVGDASAPSFTITAPVSGGVPITVSGYSLTGSQAQSMVSWAGTLNTSGSPDVFKIAVTDTARGASTKIFNIYTGAAGATSVFAVDRNGKVTASSDVNIGGSFVASSGLSGTNVVISNNTGAYYWNTRALIRSPADGVITFSNNGETNSYTLSSPTATATPTLQLGAADAATPVAQTLKVQGVVAGTSNIAGADWSLYGSAGTGTGAGGSIKLYTSPTGSTGTSQNAGVLALTIDSTKAATFAGQIVTPLGSNSVAGYSILFGSTWGIYNPNDGGLMLSRSAANKFYFFSTGPQLVVPSTGTFAWSSNSAPDGTPDTLIGRGGAASVLLGAATGSGAAVAQTLTVQGSSGNSAAAALFTIAGSDQAGTTTTGGGVKIRGGNGTTAGGTVEIWTSATTTPAVAATFTVTKQTKLAGNLWLDNALVTGLTPAVSAGLLTKSIILYDNTGAAITVYGS